VIKKVAKNVVIDKTAAMTAMTATTAAANTLNTA
jgi:hypothetical protein